jgi:hypothetical protein
MYRIQSGKRVGHPVFTRERLGPPHQKRRRVRAALFRNRPLVVRRKFSLAALGEYFVQLHAAVSDTA